MAKKQKVENNDPMFNNVQINMDRHLPATANSIRYVVVRNGHRVSDIEYDTIDDQSAIAEKEFWTLVATKHSYGEPVAIVKYDPKFHRVW